MSNPQIDNTIYDVDITSLKEYPNNPRTGNVSGIAESLITNGQYRPIVVRKETQEILAGNHTWKAAKEIGWKTIKVIYLENITDEHAKKIVLVDNRLNDMATYDEISLRNLLTSLDDLIGTGYDDISTLDEIFAAADEDYEVKETELTDEEKKEVVKSLTLAEKFLVPPFTILDQRAGYWQERRRKWISLGIKSEEGRDNIIDNDDEKKNGLTYQSLSAIVIDYYSQKTKAEEKLGRPLSLKEFEADYLVIPNTSGLSGSGTSVFDPTLTESIYKWYSKEGQTILDPFAGGSVRGVVAGLLGRNYIGLELREEQVAANRSQWETIKEYGIEATEEKPNTVGKVEWTIGDSNKSLDDISEDTNIDLIFSCPPYADLEVYSDDKDDISNMDYKDFSIIYDSIINKAVKKLNDNRFIVWVVGEVRDKKGNYYGFIPDTIKAFQKAGAELYSEGILQTSVGSVPIRAARTFQSTKRLGKVHQNVLVFVKGNPTIAAKETGLPPQYIDNKTKYDNAFATQKNRDDFKEKYFYNKSEANHGYDPTLTEILYSWFSTKNSIIYNPLASDNIEKEVARILNRKYYDYHNKPETADLIYSEVSYDNTKTSYTEFLKIYETILDDSIATLKNNRYIVLIIDEQKDKKIYNGIAADTIKLLQSKGLHYHNEAILSQQIEEPNKKLDDNFNKTKSLYKVQKTILVFVKGNIRQASDNIGQVNIGELSNGD